jgi:hypothetical protein
LQRPEDGNWQPAISLEQVNGMTFNHLHLEGLDIDCAWGGARGGFILLGGPVAADIKFNLVSCRVHSNMESASVLCFGFSDKSHIALGRHSISQTIKDNGAHFHLANTVDGPGQGKWKECTVTPYGPMLPMHGDPYGSKLDSFEDCYFGADRCALRAPGPTFQGNALLTLTGSGDYRQNNLDGIRTYIWNRETGGTFYLSKVIDEGVDLTLAPPGTRRTIINQSPHQVPIDGGAGTIAQLGRTQKVDVVFDGKTAWQSEGVVEVR